jgi:CBS domain-containing protein
MTPSGEPPEVDYIVSTKVAALVAHKGHGVLTIDPDRTLADAAELLTEHGIGALVVSSDGRAVEGVISERDLVAHLAATGDRALHLAVREAMTSEVATCTMATTADELAALMTERRFRHVPVCDDDGLLLAIVSIGDVVRARLEELSAETEQLQAYVAGNY